MRVWQTSGYVLPPTQLPRNRRSFHPASSKKNNIQAFARNIQSCSSCAIFIRASDTVSFHKNKFIPYASKNLHNSTKFDSFCSSCCLELCFDLWGLKSKKNLPFTSVNSRASSWKSIFLDICLLYVKKSQLKYIGGGFKLSENSQ